MKPKNKVKQNKKTLTTEPQNLQWSESTDT